MAPNHLLVRTTEEGTMYHISIIIWYQELKWKGKIRNESSSLADSSLSVTGLVSLPVLHVVAALLATSKLVYESSRTFENVPKTRGAGFSLPGPGVSPKTFFSLFARRL